MQKYICLIFSLILAVSGNAQTKTDTLSKSSFDPYVATQQYINQVSPAAREKSDAYFEGGYWLLLWDMIYAIVIAFVFTSFGLSSKVSKISAKVKNRNIQTLVFAFIYFLIAWILIFPLHVYEAFFREHRYGLSNQNFGQWLKDDLTGLIISSIALSVVVMVMYIFIRRSPAKWWVWTALLSIAFMTFVIFISPVFLEPVFNNYKPLPGGHLKDQILSMARANEIPAENVYEFDASRQSDRISANVSGLAGTTRIALNDNLLKQCSEDEIRSVMGHEMGHYALHHAAKMLIEMMIIFFVLFFFVDRAFSIIIKTKWGAPIENLQDIRGLPLIMMLIYFGVFLLTPVTNTMIRVQESEADLFGLNVAREPDADARIDIKLLTYRKANPGKWEEIIFFDHPSAYHRILMAMKWKAENLK
jgi:STE24 endopeptidase